MSTAPVTHIHISEREPDGSWEDCTWDSGLEFYRDAYDPSKPATHAEAQKLRAASGEPPTGGSNLTNFRHGVHVRYQKTLPLPTPAKRILTDLKPGYCSTVQGSMSAFGPLHRLSKYDRNFNGAHAIYLARTPGGVLLWCDPEAPTAAAVPVVVSEAEVTQFVNALSGGVALVAPALKWPGVPEDTVEPLTQYLPGWTGTVKPTANIRSAPHITATTKLRVVAAPGEPVVLIGTVKGDVDPDNGKNIWYLWWKNNRYEYTAMDNIPLLPKPPAGGVDDGYTKATQDAAVAAQKAADQAAIDAAKAEAAAAPVTERERIATAEANRIKAI